MIMYLRISSDFYNPDEESRVCSLDLPTLPPSQIDNNNPEIGDSIMFHWA
jgi:hypothetical protein